MTLLQSQRAAAFLMSGAAMASILISGEIAPPLIVAAVIAFVMAFVLGERMAGRGTWLWNSAVIIAFVYLGVGVAFGSMDVVVATSTFALLLSLNRLFNRRGVGDYGGVHLTSLLMIAGGAALSSELAFGLCFLVFAVAGTWSLTLTQLRHEIEDEARANRVADGGAGQLQSRRLVSARFLAVLGGLAIGALGVAALVFVSFPRVSFGLWQKRQIPGETRAGFSSEVELGGHGAIKDDPRVALRVRVEGETRPRQQLEKHWRGASFDLYDGREWRDTTREPRRARGLGAVYEFAPDEPGATVYEVELAADMANNTVFVTDRPLSIHMLRSQPAMRYTPAPMLFYDGQFDLTFLPPQSSEMRYRLRAAPVSERGLRGLGGEYPPFIEPLYLQLPENLDPRVRALGESLTRGRDPYDAAREVERHLSRIPYSLDQQPSGPDPLASFLFDVRNGHCEYFATAMAVLLRVGGVPARLVTGFYGGRYIENGDYYAVRNGDAHAWVEVFFPGRGWVTFDPTPPSARPAALETFYGRMQLWIDGMRTQWRTKVVDYDLMAQVRGLRELGRMAGDVSARLGGTGQWARLRAAGVGIAVLVAVAGLLFGALWAVRRLSGGARPLPRSQSQKRARALYRDLRRRLARRGVAWRPSQTPRELAADVRARGLPQASVVEAIVERYLAVCYGARPLEQQELDELRRQLRQV